MGVLLSSLSREERVERNRDTMFGVVVGRPRLARNIPAATRIERERVLLFLFL